MEIVLEKVRKNCVTRRVRIEEFMKTFDKNKIKKITIAQFSRALDDAGVSLTPAETNLLVDSYKHENGLDVRYRDFCDEVDSVFTMKGLEKDPTFDATAIVPPNARPVYGEPLTNAEEQELEVVMRKLAGIVKIEGTIIKDFFKDFDSNNAGTVTKSQFCRQMPKAASNKLTPEQIDLLAKAYDQQGPRGCVDVNYRALHTDLCPIEANPVKNTLTFKPQTDSLDSLITTVSDAEVVEDKCMQRVNEMRIRVADFMQSHDKTKNGFITEAQFYQSLKLAFGNLLSIGDMKSLAAKYKGQNNEVRYKGFCQKMESVFTTSGLEKAPGKDASMTGGLKLAIKARQGKDHGLSDSEMETVQNFLNGVRGIITTKRVLLTPSFQDFDRRKEDHITVEQFQRVLDNFKLLPSNPREITLLLKRFASQDVRHDPTKFVNYRQFCQCVDDSEVKTRSADLTSPLASAARMTMVPRKEVTGTNRSLPELFAVLKQHCKQHRVRLDEFFKDYDKLRKGGITQSQFGRGLAQGQFGLSDQEVRTIYQQYQDETQKDAFGEPFVKWTAFVDEIDRVFTIKNMDKDPTVDVVAATSMAMQKDVSLAKKGIELDKTQRERVFKVLKAMSVQVAQRRVELVPSFQDFDRSNSGYIPYSCFMRVVSGLSLHQNATEADAALLKQYFMENQATGMAAGREDVNYKAFALALIAIAGGATSLSEIKSPDSLREDRTEKAKTVGAALLDTSNLRHKEAPLNAGPVYSIDEIMQDVKADVQVKRIRVTEILQDSDRLRSGEVSPAQFKSALSRAGLQLEAHEIKAIEKEFRGDKNGDMINWKKFASTLEGMPSLEKNPNNLAETSYFGATERMPDLEPAEEAELDEALVRIKEFTTIRRLHMKPYFHDYDKSRRFRVTAGQFASVLDMMKVPLTQRDRSLLLKKYTVVEGRKKNGLR